MFLLLLLFATCHKTNMDELLALSVISAILLGIFGLFLVLYSILFSKDILKKQGSKCRKKSNPASLLVVLGSGK